MALESLCRIEDLVSGAPRMPRVSVSARASLGDDFSFPEMQRHTELAVPPYCDIESNLARFNDESNGIKMNFDHGTTTLGFKYKGGVILAVDSRATGGQYIGSQTMKKIVEINPYLLGTLAGGAADCVYWDRVLSKQCRLYELRNRERISVAAASKLMANMIYNYKGMGLSMGMMFAGWDKRGPSLYLVCDDGTRTQGEKFSVGSGSVYAIGVLNAGYKFDLTDEEAYALGQRAIYHATKRDAYSGGIVRVYHVTSKGWVKISEVDCMDIHYGLYPSQSAPGTSGLVLDVPME